MIFPSIEQSYQLKVLFIVFLVHPAAKHVCAQHGMKNCLADRQKKCLLRQSILRIEKYICEFKGNTFA